MLPLRHAAAKVVVVLVVSRMNEILAVVLLVKSCVCHVRQFHTAEDALNGARHIVAMQIAHDPQVRETLRQMFHERAKITVKPTKKGIKVSYNQLRCHCWSVTAARTPRISHHR